VNTVAERAAHPVALASAGIGAVAVTFGMARYGFGLLAPDIRADFGLTSGSLGLLAAASYVAYLGTSVTAGALSARLGARVIVGAGGVCAVAGMSLAGLAQSPPVLFAGLLVAGASAGLVFPPFSDVVAQRLPARLRGRVMSAISSGTGWGVALAAPLALLAGTDWRAAWLLFALIAAAATSWALVVLPAREAPGNSRGVLLPSLRWFVCPRSGPLLAGALLVGLASSVAWTFAVDHLVASGGLSSTQSRIFLGVVGVASVGGTVGGDAVRRLGGRATFMAAMALEAAALLMLGLAPTHMSAVFAAAVLFGASYNLVVAVQVIWSGRVFVERPSAGLAAVAGFNALGLLVGPPIFGVVADLTGFAAVFAAGALLLLAGSALAPRERLE
jgi:predicted MFS family arabinose efflux permease